MKGFAAVSSILGVVGGLAANLRSGVSACEGMECYADATRPVITVLSQEYPNTDVAAFITDVKAIAVMDVSVAVGMFDPANTTVGGADPWHMWRSMDYMNMVDMAGTFHFGNHKFVYMAAKLSLDNEAIGNGLMGTNVSHQYCRHVKEYIFDGLLLQLDTSKVVGFDTLVDDFVTEFITGCKNEIGDLPLMLAMSVADITNTNNGVLATLVELKDYISSIDIMQFGDVPNDPMNTYETMFVSSTSNASWSQIAPKMPFSNTRVGKSQDESKAGSVSAKGLASAMMKASSELGYQSGLSIWDHDFTKSNEELTKYYMTIAKNMYD